MFPESYHYKRLISKTFLKLLSPPPHLGFRNERPMFLKTGYFIFVFFSKKIAFILHVFSSIKIGRPFRHFGVQKMGRGRGAKNIPLCSHQRKKKPYYFNWIYVNAEILEKKFRNLLLESLKTKITFLTIKHW